MNAKKCKKLRFQARAMSAGLPDRLLLVNKRTGEVVNEPQSTRGIYRALKRAA